MRDNVIKEEKLMQEEDEHHPHGMHGGHGLHGGHGPGHDGIPPHLLLKEIFDLKEKVGKIEGMLEVILKKM